MLYAFASKDFSHIFTDWNVVRDARILYPDAVFKKFKDDEKELAVEFIKKNNKSFVNKADTYTIGRLSKVYLDISILLNKGIIYANVNTTKTGDIKILNKFENVTIDNRQDTALIVDKRHSYINEDLIISWLVAIQSILSIVGDWVDVRIHIPYPCLYYTFQLYKELPPCRIRSSVEGIYKRRGRLSIALEGLKKC